MAAGIGVRGFGTLDAIAMTWFTTNPPGTPAVVVTDARRKASAQDFDAALVTTDSVLQADPGNSEAWLLKGDLLQQQLKVRMRVQNPNEEAVEYDGAALDLEVNGKSLAYGVSDQRGSVPRYGERVLVVPVSITALNVVRQALALADGTQRESVPFVLRGKLAGGVFGAVRFSQEGSIGIASLLPRAAR